MSDIVHLAHGELGTDAVNDLPARFGLDDVGARFKRQLFKDIRRMGSQNYLQLQFSAPLS